MEKLERPNNIHHQAFLCRDAEQTRRLFEEVIGVNLVAALDFDSSPGYGSPVEYMHLFFEMGNGDHVAFFDIPDDADEKKFEYTNGFDQHIAFEVESALIDLANSTGANLTNEVTGHNSIEIGMMTADEVMRKYTAKPLDDLLHCVFIININKK